MVSVHEGLLEQRSLGVLQLDADRNHFALFVPMSACLFSSLLVSCTVHYVSLVVGLAGVTVGSFIVYLCPALICAKAVRLVKGEDSLPAHLIFCSIIMLVASRLGVPLSLAIPW
jgi:hypothetical protein